MILEYTLHVPERRKYQSHDHNTVEVELSRVGFAACNATPIIDH